MFPLFAALLLSFLPLWCYAYVVYWLDRFEREPIKLLGIVFLWGALFATIGAAIAEYLLGEGFLAITQNEQLTELATNAFFAPIVEESLKGVAILIVAFVFRNEFDSILDGIVYAAIVALGFAATEDVFYLYAGYEEQGWGYMLGLWFVRVILTGWNHAAFTAFIGIGVAVARLNPNILVKIFAPIGGWACAVLFHAVYNGLLSTASGAGALLAFCVSWVGWIAVFGIVVWSITQERNRARIYLADEVTQGTISPAQFQVATSAFRPTMTRLNAVGSGHYWDTRRFYQVCGELAQKKEQLAKYGEERGNAGRVETLRAELTRLAAVARA